MMDEVSDKQSITLTERSLAAVFVIEEDIVEFATFELLIAVMVNRFNCVIALVFKHPELLFNNKMMLSLVASGMIDRAIVTDNPSNLGLDAIECCKRLDTDYTTLFALKNAQFDFSDMLKTILLARSFSAFPLLYCSNGIIAFAKGHLRSAITSTFSNLAAFYAYYAGESALPSSPEKVADAAIDASDAVLFLTMQGLARLGGAAGLSQSAFYISSKPITAFDIIWCIDNDLSFTGYTSNQHTNTAWGKQIITVPGILSLPNEEVMLVDINPAGDFSEKKIAGLMVPRLVLTLRKTRLAITHNAQNTPVVFAMSNFNKASYLAGAFFGVALQTQQNVVIAVVDDISDDESVKVIKRLCAQFNDFGFSVRFSTSTKKAGTYQIRNQIIRHEVSSHQIYVVNDSDDFSAAQRAFIQAELVTSNKWLINFGDIVRVNAQHLLLPLDGKVERYGTASLGAFCKVHLQTGFYENLMKNADTEFIERVRHFFGKKAVKWFRYPFLFQPFDGNNLTSDIYTINNDGQIKQDLASRNKHAALFVQRHATLKAVDLPTVYHYDSFNFPDSYYRDLPAFFVTRVKPL